MCSCNKGRTRLEALVLKPKYDEWSLVDWPSGRPSLRDEHGFPGAMSIYR